MNELLKKLPNPINMDKQDIVDLLLKEEYGAIPSAPYSVVGTVEESDKRFCASKAEIQKVRLLRIKKSGLHQSNSSSLHPHVNCHR